MIVVIVVSMLLQLVAAVLALRLIPLTGRRWSWILISLGLVGMIMRRVYSFAQRDLGSAEYDLEFELLGLAISFAMILGIALILPMFRQLKDANEKLADSEERFRTVAEFTHDWEYWRRPNGDFAYISPSCVRITGYSRTKFMDDPELLERIVHPDDKDTVALHLSKEMDTGEMGDLDYRIIAIDGSVHWISHHCMRVFDEKGKYLGSRASNRNIDNRKLAEARLQKSRKQYLDLVEQAQSVILELNLAGEVIFVNGFAQNIFGYKLSELKGSQAIGTLFPSKDSEGRNLKKMISAFIHNGETLLFDEIEIIHKDGHRRWVSFATSIVLNEKAQPEGVLCVGIDITERKAAEKLKEDVERIVRHDLKSPLMGIIGLPRLLQTEDNITERQKDMLKAVEEAGEQMMNLINQSLNLYKLETGTYHYQPQLVNWLEIVSRASRDLSTQLSGLPPIEITVNGNPASGVDDIIISGDSTLLYSMAANLLKNGLEASGEEPVHVNFQTGNPCVMEIHNRLAVPLKIRDTFFKKYATHGKSSGTGLGTYSAVLAVRAHRGHISMQSSDTEGTFVRVELPE
ncbi:MAG: hypothetical protein BA863_08495 [Desulfovibrio sp. S3730MH75]|nr:MAG: hypothetical protein BA863_08495 [Desulfovibrio sp. S3730MH75]